MPHAATRPWSRARREGYAAGTHCDDQEGTREAFSGLLRLEGFEQPPPRMAWRRSPTQHSTASTSDWLTFTCPTCPE